MTQSTVPPNIDIAARLRIAYTEGWALDRVAGDIAVVGTSTPHQGIPSRVRHSWFENRVRAFGRNMVISARPSDLLSETAIWRSYLKDLDKYRQTFPGCVSPAAFLRAWGGIHGSDSGDALERAVMFWDARFPALFKRYAGIDVASFSIALEESCNCVRRDLDAFDAALRSVSPATTAAPALPQWNALYTSAERLYELLVKAPRGVLVG